MIATEGNGLVNEDVWYRFKFDSGTVQNDRDQAEGEGGQNKKIRLDLFTHDTRTS